MQDENLGDEGRSEEGTEYIYYPCFSSGHLVGLLSGVGEKKDFDGGGGDRVGHGHVIQVQLSKLSLKVGCAYLACVFVFERWESWEIWTAVTL